MNHGTCKHFNGLMNQMCKRGVSYEVNWHNGPKPCIKMIHKSKYGGTYLKPGEDPATSYPFPGSDKAKPCPFYEEPTKEEVFKDREESDKALLNALIAIKISQEWRVHPRPDKDRSGVIECPICKGKLNLYQSSFNGHVHGQCETENCIKWME